MEKALSCSFCKERFSDSIKLIPECGNSICGSCYEILQDDIDEELKQYKCPPCDEEHLMPRYGLPNNKHLLELLKTLPEKPLHENAKTLKIMMREVDDQIEKLQSFDGRQAIEFHCDQLQLEVSESTESAIKHLREIEANQLKQIKEYREKCLASLSNCQSLDSSTRGEKELSELAHEVSQFKARWNDYFRRIEAYETESEIEKALVQTALYISKMESMKEILQKEALSWGKMVFKDNSKQFLDEWKHVGEIEIYPEEKPKVPTSLAFSTSPPSVFESMQKKITIQETPSFTLTGHSNFVRQVLFLPDGRLASCSNDKTIKIWNVENGKLLFELIGHTDSLYSLALLPNGHLVSGSEDKTIKIWDLEQRKEIRTIQAHSRSVLSLGILNKNGNLASYSSDDTIKLWNLNLKEDEPVSIVKGHGNTQLTFRLFGILSNDYLVTYSRHKEKKECMLRVWNPNKPNPIKTVPTGCNDAFSLFVLSNDQVALGFSPSGTIKIIDLENDALSKTKERAHDEGVHLLAQLSNANLLSVGLDNAILTIKVWNLLDWNLLQIVITDHSKHITTLSISSDEKFLASGSADNTIKLWQISSD